jgi:hypothetical protein
VLPERVRLLLTRLGIDNDELDPADPFDAVTAPSSPSG